jgi:glutaconate CoA-transferase subunit A
MRDKRAGLDEAVSGLRDGMTIGIGGWGSRRKPMALVRAILQTPVRDLTLVSFGGPDVGLLCAAGKLRELVFGFVSLDSVPYDPHFVRARQSGSISVRELDEGMVVAGLRAAGQRLPFLPIRAGLGSDVMTYYPGIRTVRSPYDDGEELVAMPALPLDMAFVHLNRADAHGNAAYLGPDPYFDDLFCLAAAHRVVSCEQIVSTADLVAAAPPQALLLNRMMVDAVVETPNGAHFTSCVPDYGRDEAFQRAYAAAAADLEAWPAFAAEHGFAPFSAPRGADLGSSKVQSGGGGGR